MRFFGLWQHGLGLVGITCVIVVNGLDNLLFFSEWDEKQRGEAVVSSEMKDLVEFIAKSLVDDVDRVEITEVESQTNVIELKVAKEDIGKVIGRQGRTADAIRTILSCAAAKTSKRYILQIIDQ